MSEHYYTGAGRQRAVFLGAGWERARFSLDLSETDEACVEVSLAPEEAIRKGRGEWRVFEGGLGGSLEGVSALRVHVKRCDGWVKLVISNR